MNLLEFIASNFFLCFWILIAVCSITVPFGAYGIKKFFDWINRKYLKANRGYVEVRHKLPNDHIETFYALPTGNFIEVKTVTGAKTQIPINLKTGWVVFDGSLKIVDYDENWSQMSQERGIKSTISQEDTTKGWRAAYETGKLIGSAEFLGKLERMVLILLIITVIGVAVTGYSIYSARGKGINTVQLANDVAAATADRVLNIRSGGNNASIPAGVPTV